VFVEVLCKEVYAPWFGAQALSTLQSHTARRLAVHGLAELPLNGQRDHFSGQAMGALSLIGSSS
jgi:hypothetical protein